MALPIFFVEDIHSVGTTQVLSEESSKHIVQVLRMAKGDHLRLTDGKGKMATAVITDDHKKKCEVVIREVVTEPRPYLQNVVAISLLKNNTRFEWFLEKAAELGISKVIPLLCTRTEKQHFRYERMNAILVSALIQSQQSWQTELSQPLSYKDFISQVIPTDGIGFIAHCVEGDKNSLLSSAYKNHNSKVVLIGPEGDFTSEEIEQAIAKGFVPVELGNTRLRTETAGLVAAALLQLG